MDLPRRTARVLLGVLAMYVASAASVASAQTGPTFGDATIPDQTYYVGVRITDLTFPRATGGSPYITPTASDGLSVDSDGLAYRIIGDILTELPGLSIRNSRLFGTPLRATDALTYTFFVGDRDTYIADTLTFSITVREPSVRISTTRLTVSEGGNRTYSVALSTQPSGEVTITPSITPEGHDLTLTPDGGVPAATAALTFTTNNWNIAQTVSVTAAEDGDSDNDISTLSHAASGAGSFVARPLIVTVTDNDADTDPAFDDDATIPDRTYTLGETVALTLPIATGGNGILTYALVPDLTAIVSGLTFDDTARVLSGTANALTPAITLTYTATDSDTVGDTASLTFTVTVNPAVQAALVFAPTELNVSEGGTNTYGIELSVAPDSGDVVVTPSAGGGLTLAPATLTFTATSWDTAQSVTITAARDDDTVNETIAVSHAVSGAGNYTGLATAGGGDFTVTVTDTSIPAVIIAPTDLTVDEGVDGAYTVQLATEPAAGAQVMVTPTVQGAGHGVTITPNTALAFDDSNWNTAQSVVVSVADDDLDFADATATISHAVSGYTGVTSVDNVVVTVDDNDTDTAPAFASGASVPAQSYTENTQIPALVLPEVAPTPATQGNGDITYTLTPIPSGLNFDATTRVLSGTPDTVTTTAITLTYTAADEDGNTADTDTASLLFTVTVDPAPVVTPAALVFDPSAVSVMEGGTAAYGIELSVEPTTGSVTVTPDATTGLTFAPAALTFSATSWNTAQDIVITAARDDDTANETLTVSHAVVGAGNYTALSTAGGGDVTVTVTDTSIPAVTISTDTLSVNEGESDVYTVRLATIPTANVVITPTPTSTATLSPTGALTFTATDWNDEQTVTVTGMADADAVANADATISHAATSTDTDYDAITPIDDVTVTVTETDSVGFTVTPPTLSLTEGNSASYTVVLTAAPSVGAVTVTPNSPDSDAVSIFSGTAELTFTSANWNVAQVVSVIAEEDGDANDEMVLIGNTVTVSDSSSDYAAQIGNTAGVTVTVTDPTAPDTAPSFGAATVDDETYTAGVAIPDLTLPLATPGNGATTYTLTPDIDIAIDGLNFDDTMRVVSGTPSAATTAVTLTYTAADDDTNNADTDTASLTFAITVVPAPTLVFAPTALSVDEGATGAYGIELSVAPTTGNVVVTPSATGLTLAPATLTFTDTTWNTAQSVTITAARDDDTANETIAVSHAVSGAGNYTGLATAGGGDFTVTVTDTSIPAVTIAPTDLTVDEGVDGAYTVQLATEPAAGAQVMVTPTVEGAGHGVSIAPNTVLVFDAGNWNTAQSVVVSAADDDLDFADSTATISHTVAGYTGVTSVDNVVVTVDDDDDDTAPAFASGASVPAQSYTENAQIPALVLPEVAPTPATQGNGDITYTLTPIPSGLNFDATTRVLSGTPDTVTTTAITLTYTAADEDGNTADTDTASLLFTVTVDPAAPAVVAAVTIAPPTLTIAEGAMDTYTVTLTTDPGGAVTVTPTSDNIADVPTPAALTFATGAWNTPQTVTVNANADVLEDFADENAEITHVVTGYSGVSTAPAVAVTVTDPHTNTVPSFAATQADQAYTVGDTVDLTLPEASGGNGAPRYTLTPDIATAIDGLTFDDNTRIVSGTPNAVTPAAVTLTYTAADSDAVTVGDTASLTFTVTVNPAVTPVALTFDRRALTVTEEGAAVAYTIALSVAPDGGDVTVTPSLSSGVTGLTFAPAALTFSAGNFDTAQNIAVTAAHDFDGADDTVAVSHAVVGAGNYATLTAGGDVTVTVEDNDPRGVTVTLLGGVSSLSLSEGSNTATYSVVLDTEPVGGDVAVAPSVAPADHDLTLNPATLDFTATDWNVAQTVQIMIGEDDDGILDRFTITHAASGADYDGVTAATTLPGITNDDDPRGVTISETTLTVAETAIGTYTVRLDTQPPGDVLIMPSSSDTGVATVSPIGALTFTNATWNIEQTVTVTGVTDGSASITHAVGGHADYTTRNPVVTAGSIAVTVVADTAPAFVSGVPVPDQTYTAGTQIATLTLPEVDSNNPGNGAPVYTLTPTTDIPGGLNFDDTARTLSGTPNAVAAATTVTLTYTVADTDGVSGAADEDSLTFAVTVNPAAPVTPAGVTISTPTLTVTEGGDGNYTVVLDTQPSADVMITPSVNPATATVSPTGALTFTDMNWNVEQTVTVTGVADADATANDTATISHAATSTDSDYVIANTDIDTVTVTITEAQTRGVTFTPPSVAVGENGGATYTVELDSEPSGDVTVTLSVSAGGHGVTITTPTTLTFDSGNWDMAQDVSVAAAQDDADFADETATISHAVDGADYTGTSADEVVVTVTDNDTDSAPAFASGESVPAQSYTENAQIPNLTLPEVDPMTAGNGDITYTLAPLPSGLVFTANTRILSGTPDAVTAATTTTLTYTAADEDAITVASDEDTLTFTVTINPAPPVVVTLRLEPDALTIDEAAAAVAGSIYTVRLSSQPASDVTVTPSIAATNHDLTLTFDDAALLGAALTFVAAEWNDAQTVTVTAADDDDITDDTVTITHAATGTSAPIADADVTVTVTDTSTQGIALSPATLSVDEGERGAYAVQLDTIPVGGDVTVMLSLAGGAATFAPTTALTFSDSTWNTAQSVTVTTTADDDATANPDVTIAHSANGADYAGVSRDLLVTVGETHTRGVMINRASFGITEGATETYNVTLTAAPDGGNVTVTPSSDDPAATVSGALTFTATDWDEAQSVIVTAIEDTNNDNETATITHMVAGADYAGVAATPARVLVMVTDNDTPGVTISETTLTVDEGDADGETYTVRLAVAPSGDVTVTPASGDTAVATVSGALTFSDSNWNTVQTVTVTGAEDADAVDDNTDITHMVEGADYAAVIAADVAVTIDDDESVGITVAPDRVSVDEGDSDFYTVELTSAPSVGEVTVTPGSADAGAVSVTAALVFDDANWNMPQTVSVRGVPDEDAVGESVVISNAVTVSDGSSDYASQIGNAGDVTVTVTDSGTAAVTISTPTLTVAEDGEGTYTIVLMSAPGGGGNATVTPTSADPAIATVSGALTFSAANWNDMQTVTVTGVADADTADDSVSITHTVSGYDNITTANAVAVTVTDTDMPARGVTLAGTPVNVTEGMSAEYTVVLDTQPSGSVTVTPASGDSDVATVSGALTFSDSNWDTAQTVTVTGAEDGNGVTDTTDITHTVEGADYDGFSVADDPVAVTVTDNDMHGVEISDATLTVDEGASDTYTVRLDTEPTANVVITPTSDNAVATVSGALTFTTANWNEEQSVTVSGTADDDATANAAAVITHTAASTDADYNALAAIDSVTVTVGETDTREVTITPTSVDVPEGGFGAYTIVLTSEPTGDVMVTPTIPANTDLSLISSGALTFDANNWNVAQPVSLTATADDDAVAAPPIVITHTVAGADYGSNNVTAAAVTATITESHSVGITVSPTTVAVGEDATLSYTVVLDSAPSAGNVTVTASSADTGAVAIDTSTNALVFNAGNWNMPQTISVGGAEDNDADDESVVITNAVTVSVASSDYAGENADPVTVNVTDSDTASVTISATTLTIDEDDDGTYTVRLTSAPSGGGDATVTPVSADTTIATVSGALVFDAANWNVAQNVVVTGVADDDVDDEMVSITHTVSGYTASAGKVDVTVTDTSVRRVVLSGTPVSVTEGSTGNYDVVLDTQPTGNVTVTPTSDDDDIATVTGALTFTTANWNTAQNITVAGTQDADSADESTSIRHAVTGADYESNNVTAANVAVTVNDDETAGVTISDATLAIDEGSSSGAANTYTVGLTTIPTGAVVVSLSIDNTDVTADANTVNFTVSNWNMAQTVTISAAEDHDGNNDIASITHTVSGGGYDGASITNAVVTVTVTDNDTDGITLTGSPVTIAENGSGNYTVVLDTLPDATVMITPTSGDPAAATVSGPLTFTTANWNMSQMVEVTGVDDADATNETVTITHTASGSADYAAVDLTAETVTVTVTDNNTRGITLSGTMPVTVTEGMTANYGVVLDTQPTGDVVVTPTSTAVAIATVSGPLTFGPANWNTVQNVMVTGVEDSNTETDSASITHAVTGADYAGVTVANVAVTVTDNDTAGVTISTGTLTIGEGTSSGAGNTYTVVLNTEPNGDVTVMLDSNNDDVTTNAATLNFGMNNWNTPQNVIVSADEDPDATDDNADITHTVSGANYAGAAISNNPVVVTVTDNETRSVTITPTTVTVPEDDSATYTVRLTSAPDGGTVMVTPSIPSGNDLSLFLTGGAPAATAVLTFDASNWNIAQPVTLTAAHDDDAVDDANIVITHTVTGADYDSETAADVTATITENDTVGITVSPTTVAVTEGAAGSYTVRLTSAPSAGNVVVTPSSADAGAVSVSAALVFGVGNWNTPQVVNVGGVADDDAVNETGVVITNTVTVSDPSSDYASQNAASVTVNVTDPGTASVTVAPTTLSVAENGNNTYTIVLTSAPSGGGNAMVTPASADPAIATVSGALVFGPANWNMPQDVMVTGVADADANNEMVDITHTVSGYDSITTAATVAVTVTDNNTRGITLTGSPVSIAENGSGNYTVVLDTQPDADVMITPTSGDPAAATVSGPLTFTPANWNMSQMVEVTGVDDADATDETVTITHAASGSADYAAVDLTAETVTVTVTDDDPRGVTLSATPVTVTEGLSANYGVVLDTQPTGDVTVTPASDAAAIATVSAALVFTTANWNTVQSVTVTGTQDDDTETDSTTIMHAVTGADYGSVTVANVAVTVTDNDMPGVTISTATLTIGEGTSSGAGNTYTVVLNTQPNGDVSVTLISDNTDVTLSAATLNFGMNNWNTAQNVIVSADEDPDATNDTADITHTVSGANYAGAAISNNPVVVTVTDNEMRGVTITPPTFALTEGDSPTYSVALTSAPDGGNVTVTPTIPAGADVRLEPSGAFVFDASNWSVAQTRSVVAEQDEDAVPDADVTITHAVTGADYESNNVTAGNLTVMIAEDDSVGVTIGATTLTVDEGGAAMFYTVVLDAAPSVGIVTVTPTNPDSGAVSVSGALVFDASNWNTSQRVMVSGVADEDAVDETVVVSNAVTVSDSSSDYMGQTAPSVTVTVTDPGTASVTISTATLSVTEGEMNTYTIVLMSAPGGGGNAVVTPTSGDNTIATVSPSSLIFSATNWDDEQTVRVSGADDADGDNETTNITHTVSGYDSVTTADPVAVTVTDPDTVGVMLSTDTVTLTESTTGDYTVRLTTQPTANVTITPDGDDDAIATVSGALVFSPGNWNTMQQVVITGVADANTETDTITITHTSASADTDYNGFDVGDVTATVTDTDTAGVTISNGTRSIQEGSNSGADNTYTVVLNTEPSGAVTVALVSSDTDAVMASVATLNFSATDWNTPKDVVLTGVEDDDGNNESVNITHTVSGANYNGAAVSPDPVVVTVTDDDPLGITLSASTLSVTEDATANYTVRLNTRPDANVMITPTSDDTGAAGVSGPLTFAPGNWNIAQNIEVTGEADDDATNESVNITHAATGSADYAAVVNLAAVTVTVTDSDMRGVTLSATPVTVTEGLSANYGVVLDTRPSGDVMVTPTSAAPAIATVSGVLVFGPGNWNTVQNVVVTGVDDSNTETDNTSITHAVTGADYASVTLADVAVTVTDNDMPGVTISTGTRAIGEGTSSGAGNTYTVVLNTEPSGDVTVTLSSDNPDVTTNPATLNFTTANWNMTQDVVVSADEDADAADESASITHRVSGANYNGVAISNNPVVVTVTDNDMQGVTVALPSGGASLPEGSDTGTYTVVLTSAPVGGVVVLTPRSDNRDVTFGVSTLRFSDTNWNVAQTVMLTVANDDDANGDNAVISHTVSGADYGSVTVADLSISIVDDDTRGVTLSRNTLSVAESATANYTMRLTTQPTADVVITPASGDPAIATVSGPLTFTSMNWNIAQPVMVAGVKDADAVADAAISITHSAASTDTDYDGITAGAVTVTVTETDTRGVTISRDSVTVLGTAAATYTVVLDTLPTASVIVTPSSDTDAVTVAPATLTFTNGNWNTAQTVTVTGTARALISHTVTGTGDYTGVTAASVRVLFGNAEAMDALNDVILPEVAHVMVGNHVSAITHRITQARTPTGGTSAGLRANLGGHSTLEELAATHAQTMVDDDFDTKTLLGDSDFAMPLNADGVGGLGGANLALWGSGDYRNIGGDSNNVDWDGSLFSAHLGVDVALQPGLLAGVMLAWSEADLEYTNNTTATTTTGDYELDMTSLHPYLGWRALNGRLDMWTTIGYGSGDLKITEANAASATADATLQTIGVGGSGTLLASRDTELRVKGEVQATRLEVGQAADDAFNEMEADASQARLALEATRTVTTQSGAQVSPSLEFGMRYDGGDGATGNGVEIGAGLRYHNAGRGLTLETRMRALLSHSGDTKDQGISATLNLTPGADRQGLSLSLTPAYGNAASGVQNVWDKGVPTADSDSDLNARMSVEVGYGFAGFADGLLTPYSEMTFDDDNKTYRMGMRWNLGETFTLNLANERLEKDDAVAEDVYLLEGEVKF